MSDGRVNKTSGKLPARLATDDSRPT